MAKTFEELEESPIKGIELEYDNEKGFIEAVQRKDGLIYLDSETLKFELDILKLEEFHKWAGDVLEYVKENTPKYSFYEAIAHMRNGGKAIFLSSTFYISASGALYRKPLDQDCKHAIITEYMIDSKEWELV